MSVTIRILTNVFVIRTHTHILNIQRSDPPFYWFFLYYYSHLKETTKEGELKMNYNNISLLLICPKAKHITILCNANIINVNMYVYVPTITVFYIEKKQQLQAYKHKYIYIYIYIHIHYKYTL